MTGDLLALVVRANLVAAVAILLILALRPGITRRFGARVAYALWAVAPLAVLTSLLPARRVVVEAGSTLGTIVERQAQTPPPSMVPDAVALAAPLFDPAPWGLAIWTLGAGLSVALLAWRQHSFGRSLGALRREAGVYRAEAAGVGPAVVGALFPRIIVPSDFEARFAPEERDVVLAHEETHFRRGDPLVNGVVALAQCLCWFNPLVHLAAFYVRFDQELACDAAVIARFPGARKRYAEAMLKTQLAPMAAPLACYWPGRSAHPMKQRIAMLKQATPDRSRRVMGLALVVGLSLSAGVVAWAAQPARLVTMPQTQAARIAAQAEADRASAIADHAASVADQARTQADRDARAADAARRQADQARLSADKDALDAERARREAEAAAVAAGVAVEALAEDPSASGTSRPAVADAPYGRTLAAPEWAQTPSAADYPYELLRGRSAALVKLNCRARADGSLEDCAVLSAGGSLRMAKAAMLLVPKFRLKPHTRDGVSVAGAWVTIPLRFEARSKAT